MKTSEAKLIDHLIYALQDIWHEVNVKNTEVALMLIKDLQVVVESVAAERANLESQMADFYDSSSVLDDEEVL